MYYPQSSPLYTSTQTKTSIALCARWEICATTFEIHFYDYVRQQCARTNGWPLRFWTRTAAIHFTRRACFCDIYPLSWDDPSLSLSRFAISIVFCRGHSRDTTLSLLIYFVFAPSAAAVTAMMFLWDKKPKRTAKKKPRHKQNTMRPDDDGAPA